MVASNPNHHKRNKQPVVIFASLNDFLAELSQSYVTLMPTHGEKVVRVQEAVRSFPNAGSIMMKFLITCAARTEDNEILLLCLKVGEVDYWGAEFPCEKDRQRLTKETEDFVAALMTTFKKEGFDARRGYFAGVDVNRVMHVDIGNEISLGRVVV